LINGDRESTLINGNRESTLINGNGESTLMNGDGAAVPFRVPSVRFWMLGCALAELASSIAAPVVVASTTNDIVARVRGVRPVRPFVVFMIGIPFSQMFSVVHMESTIGRRGTQTIGQNA
jgi:hypothetical protein